ncbi:SPFH domain-containing protein [Pelomonas sp. P7]|uniref:SPFH domain-containing protein n=1 Tax=Pelomonas caseinilytica TaxID=2906763 RepID=A0ABS8X8V4_9BURK|nr:SPFH domain-containing protein [Pelomonas sp. P7]MCE4535925.1 SPFH domain-containing protein [Pelomonas sp. P7]
MQSITIRKETVARSVNGLSIIPVALAIAVLATLASWVEAIGKLSFLLSIALGLVEMAVLRGFYILQPNQAMVLTLFGKYTGTDRSEGLRWSNPLMVRRLISQRARNLNAPPIKVNDKRGNPVEISAAVVWCVGNPACAVFDVDNYETFVNVQAEAAIRHLASQYAYDEGEDLAADETTLRAGQDEVSASLIQELLARLAPAGVAVLDAKITHLAYAPEIAQVMLRRQQAEAIISARKKIVQGAVTMVEEALRGLSEREIVVLDDERKAAMVSNLLVVLCSDKDTQPIVNAGTLYA